MSQLATNSVKIFDLDAGSVHNLLLGQPAAGLDAAELTKAVTQAELTAAEARDAKRRLYAEITHRIEQGPVSKKAVDTIVKGHDIPAPERERARLAVLAHQKLTGAQVASMLHDPSPRVRNAAKRRLAKGTRTSGRRAEVGALTWDQVKDKYPVYAAPWMDHAVNEFNDDGTGEMTTPELDFTEETVDLRDVCFDRRDRTHGRVVSLEDGFQSGSDVPPVLLVERGGEIFTVDGHHRLTAQEALGRTKVRAVIAHSTLTAPYTGKVAIGKVARRRPKAAPAA